MSDEQVQVTGNPDDAECIHCGSVMMLSEVKSERNDLEQHITSRCGNCGKATKHLYNLALYAMEPAGGDQ